MIYNFLIFFLVISFMPILLWKMVRFGKYKQSLLFRLGLKKTTFKQSSNRIWLHANSVGEVVALSSIYHKLVQKYPNIDLVVSCNTETGLAKAQQILSKASYFFYLPIDFSFLMKQFVRKVNARLLIISEGDYWYHLFKEQKKSGGKIAIVNGKISEKSFQRFAKFKSFSKSLFSHVDVYYLQSNEDKQRLLSLGVDSAKLHVFGSVKFDNVINLLDLSQRQAFRKKLQLEESEKVITFGSTHPGEEKLLLEQLSDVRFKEDSIIIILVPRHLERVSSILEEIEEPIALLSDLSRGVERDSSIILIDQMGLLTSCYQVSEIAIVGGSFFPGVGGHNILEPIQCAVPVFFGPFMYSQKVIANAVITADAGLQIDRMDFSQSINKFLEEKDAISNMRNAGKALLGAHKGVSEKTFVRIEKDFLKTQ